MEFFIIDWDRCESRITADWIQEGKWFNIGVNSAMRARYTTAVLTWKVKVKDKHVSVGLSDCRTIGLLDQRAVGPAGCRTNGLSDYSYASKMFGSGKNIDTPNG
jgi:hypothetical protein